MRIIDTVETTAMTINAPGKPHAPLILPVRKPAHASHPFVAPM